MAGVLIRELFRGGRLRFAGCLGDARGLRQRRELGLRALRIRFGAGLNDAGRHNYSHRLLDRNVVHGMQAETYSVSGRRPAISSVGD